METTHYWFCEPDGSVSEPVSEEQLLEALRAGRLREDNPVCQVGGDTWLPAWSFPGLAGAFQGLARRDSASASPTLPPPPKPTVSLVGQVICDPAAAGATESGGRGLRLRRGLTLASLLVMATSVLGNAYFRTMIPDPQKATTRDGFLAVTLPYRWELYTGRPGHELQATSEDRLAFIIIDKVPPKRVAASRTLEAVEASLCRESMAGVKRLQVGRPQPFRTKGLVGVEREMVGDFEEHRMFILTVTAACHHGHYRLALYTPARLERQRRDDLEDIARSLEPG